MDDPDADDDPDDARRPGFARRATFSAWTPSTYTRSSPSMKVGFSAAKRKSSPTGAFTLSAAALKTEAVFRSTAIEDL